MEFVNSSTDLNGTITSVAWNFGDGNISSDANPVHSYSLMNLYPVSLAVQSSTGCRSQITKMVEVKPVVEAAFASVYDCLNRSVFFKDQSTALNGNIVSWHWDFEHSASVLQNPLHRYDTNGIYPVTLTVTSDEPCTASVTKEVAVQCEESGYVFIPSAFTPDNDGKNESFIPVFSQPADFTLMIYNRWGKQIFSGKNTGWNGRTENGMFYQPGVYLYRVEWMDSRYGRKINTGHFTLLK